MSSKKIVVITGGSRGIGAATAKLFAKNGYSVCINYLSNEVEAQKIVDAINDTGGRCLAIQADISKEKEIVSLFEKIDERLGTLSVLVNNAGVLKKQCRLEELTENRLNEIFRVNVTGSFLCAREAVKRMSTKHGGRGGAIVNVSSMAALKGSPNEYVDYAASKGAIDTMTRGLSLEVASESIRVNGVRPGLIYTEMHASGGEAGRVDRLKANIPMKRGGESIEIAEAIYWLASDKASFSTGAILDVSGGL
jgi:NAD(P)-dependent dehydrogenase (short-subunit alcohol dehydrogenase family)